MQAAGCYRTTFSVVISLPDFFQRKWFLEDCRGLAVCRVNLPLVERKMSLLKRVKAKS